MFDLPELRIEQRTSRLDYELTDASGQLVAQATQAAGPEPHNKFMSMFTGGVADGRLVVQVGAPDGTLLFYVDHFGGSPTAIVGASGAVIGRLAEDRYITANRMYSGSIAGSFARVVGGAVDAGESYRLQDAADRSLCEVHVKLRRTGNHMGEDMDVSWRVVGALFIDMNGTQLASVRIHGGVRTDRYHLWFHYRLPEPLRTLVSATPLALDLNWS